MIMNRPLLLGYALSALLGAPLAALAAGTTPMVYETEKDLVTTADFDGDGREDVVIMDKASGKYRLGYQQSAGVFNWIKFRFHNLKYVSGMSAGHLLNPEKWALALASADSGQLLVVDVSNPNAAGTPERVPFKGLGPNVSVALDIGGAGNTPLSDLYVCSIYNADPTPNRLTLLRSTEGRFSEISDAPVAGSLVYPNVITLKAGGPALVASIVQGDDADGFRVDDLSSGKPTLAAEIKSVPKGGLFVVGNFHSPTLTDVLFYVRGENKLTVHAAEEAGGKVQFGAAKTFELAAPIKQVLVLKREGKSQLLIISGEGESAGIYNFDGTQAPALVQSAKPQEGEVFFGAAVLADGFVGYGSPKGMRESTKYSVFQWDGTQLVAGRRGSLATLADSDEITVPKIRELIVSQTPEKSFADMKLYTNVIPGTTVRYVMVPIPGGEFAMGSPESEKGRKPDEGPQHKIKINPFWMGMFEITWNEYEVFQYPDDEKQLRKNYPTPDNVNQVSDAVTRPSKPYVEMSFGMGKDGYPAIAMTHHAANKYCHWLSAKTGHFYRLPTEAEWEFACRAGTTTAYSFGDDASQLGQYAWFGRNSDFKYQKVGRKKPNPWGLHDMHGNVVEWCLDQYDPDYFKQFKDAIAVEPWVRATKPYPHSVRGGSWDDEDAAVLRSAARRGSERAWKAQDPQLPKSYWWLSDAQFVGFRIIRPLEVPPEDSMVKCWISGTEKD